MKANSERRAEQPQAARHAAAARPAGKHAGAAHAPLAKLGGRSAGSASGAHAAAPARGAVAAQAVWPLRVAAALLCLVLASSYLLSGLYARYTTAATGTDEARVAVFHVAQTPASDSQEFAVDAMTPGSSQTYTVTVKNESEVAVEYRMDVQNITENLPLTWSMTENGQDVETGYIPAGDTTERTYTLMVTWPKDASAATTNNQSADYMGKVDLLRLSLSASQID